MGHLFAFFCIQTIKCDYHRDHIRLFGSLAMFRPLGQKNTTPSEELSYFTNRVDELTAFNRILNIPESQPIPVLMFYGVGGAGKSWLLKRLRQQTEDIPTVYQDLDPTVIEQS